MLYNIVLVFAVQHESAVSIHMPPSLELPSRPLPTYAMLYVITEHWAELCVIQQLPVIHMVVYIWWWWCSR